MGREGMMEGGEKSEENKLELIPSLYPGTTNKDKLKNKQHQTKSPDWFIIQLSHEREKQ